MPNYKQPPIFKDKPYEQYIEELKGWTYITELEKSKQAIAVALSFLQNDSTHMRDKVFSEIKVDELKEDDGMDKLIKFMDNIYKKDLTSAYEYYTTFHSFKRSPHETIENYISEFKRLYNQTKKYLMELPQSVLAFKLLDGSLLDNKDKQLVLTCIDYDKKLTLFTQTQTALKSFFENQFTQSEQIINNSNTTESTLIKESYEIPTMQHPNGSLHLNGSFISPKRFNHYNRKGYTYQNDSCHQNKSRELNTPYKSNTHAFNGTTSRKSYASHLHTTPDHESITKAEATKPIHRPRRHHTFIKNQVYQCGDKVYYKHNSEKKWRGPGVVTEQVGKVIFVQHEDVNIRVPSCRLIKRDYEFPNIISIHSELENNNMGRHNKNRRVKYEIISRADIQNKDGSYPWTTITASNSRKKIFNLPKIGDKVDFREVNDEQWKTAQIMSRAGKSTGKYASWFNIENTENNEKTSLDFNKDVSEWKLHNKNKNSTEALNEANTLKAKHRELERWKNFHVYEEVSNKGYNVISTQWVILNKSPMKARLVVKGFEDDTIIQQDLPTVAKDTIRLFLAISSTLKWKVESLDVKSAFLQGEISRELYIMPPQEACVPEERIWKVKKVVYGGSDTSRNWFLTVKKELLSLNCQQSSIDKAMFRWYHNSKMAGLLVLHADDYFYAGTELFRTKVISKVCDKYKISSQSVKCSKHNGLEILQNENSILLGQSVCDINEIPVSITRMMHKNDELKTKEKKQLRSLIDKLDLIANQSRPDLSFDLLKVNMKFKTAKVEDIIYINKVVKKLKSNKSTLLFPNLGNLENLRLVIFNDAGYANLPDRFSSTGGRIVCLTGKTDKTCPISWSSTKIKGVVKSSLAAEGLSLVEGLESAYSIGNLLTEMIYDTVQSNKIPIIALVDSKALEQNIHSTTHSNKCLDVGLDAIQQSMNKGEVSLKWIPHTDQLADCLTKNGSMTNRLLDFVKRGVIQGIKTF